MSTIKARLWSSSAFTTSYNERDLTAAMTLLDKNENPQIAVSESKDGSLFALNDNKGNTRIILGNLSQGPTLRLYDERGQIMGKVP
jgi:hypothetical protein